jgi:hypothetical protein
VFPEFSLGKIGSSYPVSGEVLVTERMPATSLFNSKFFFGIPICFSGYYFRNFWCAKQLKIFQGVTGVL